MIVALAGQPNCGKSTIFNTLAGYKATTANFPGQTVTYLRSMAMIGEETIELLDLPGTYSLTSTDLAELETRDLLLSGEVDIVVNVLDASTLSRSLELTLQLLEMGIPMVVCLNMMDDARRKGNRIDLAALSGLLGVPVVGMVARSGEGLGEFLAALKRQGSERRIGVVPRYADDVEKVVAAVTGEVDPGFFAPAGLTPRFIAIKVLEGDREFTDQVAKAGPGLMEAIRRGRKELSDHHGREPDGVISSERHALAMELFERVGVVGPPAPKTITDRLDAVLLHPFLGYLSLAAIFYGVFWGVFTLGGFVETPILGFFEKLSGTYAPMVSNPFLRTIVAGLIAGISAGTAIVLPYLAPFFLFLALLEDTGYIPRMAFLTDALMHRMGLHGKSAFPLLIGYGCSVPAVMGARILESPRDRFVTTVLTVMIPCSARISIIFGLVAAFVSPALALAVFLVNLLVLGLLGRIMTRNMAGNAPGMILEIPPYRLPQPRILLIKTWIRLREFIVIAWPILVAGSIVFALLESLRLEGVINGALRPLTWVLGLPAAIGIPLVFGIMRKELSLLMLFAALGTSDIPSVLTPVQILSFTMFVIFYVPCLSTISVLIKEQGGINTLKISALTVAIALVVALAVRGLALLAGL